MAYTIQWRHILAYFKIAALWQFFFVCGAYGLIPHLQRPLHARDVEVGLGIVAACATFFTWLTYPRV